MKKKDKIIAKALEEILYPDSYGWPPRLQRPFLPAGTSRLS